MFKETEHVDYDILLSCGEYIWDIDEISEEFTTEQKFSALR